MNIKEVLKEVKEKNVKRVFMYDNTLDMVLFDGSVEEWLKDIDPEGDYVEFYWVVKDDVLKIEQN